MLIHPTMSLAIAEAKRDDLMREIRPPRGGRRATPLRLGGAMIVPDSDGVARRLGQTLRRAYRSRAAEPVS